MRTQKVLTTPKASLVAGLDWIALERPAKLWSLNKDLRGKIDLSGANRIVAHSANSGGTILNAMGMYAPNELEQIEGAKTLHSLAIAFIHAYPQHSESILVWRVGAKQAAIIVVQNGVPVADVVQDDADVIKLMKVALAGRMGARNHTIYTNDPVAFLDGIQIGEDTLLSTIGKATKLVRVPPRPAVVASSIALLAVFGIGGLYAQHLAEVKKQERLAAQREAEDPLPPYEAILATSIGRLGIERKALLQLLSEVEKGGVWTQGWILTQIECTPGQCTYMWNRDGGITAALLAAFPKAQMLSDSNSEKVFLRHTVALPASGLPSLNHAVPQKVAASYVNVYQVWRNAKVAVNENENPREFKVWPKPTQGNVSLLPSDATLKARPISVVVPLPLAKELVSSTPAAVWWSGIKIVYTPGEIQKLLNVTLTGSTYVR